jgi:ParB-like chromosome segregation protein Spo0J
MTDERIGKYKVHPVARLFPLLQGEEFEELKKSTREQGLHYPIVVTVDGILLDGRNRLRACLELGKEPGVQSYRDDYTDLEDFILAANLFRRHLTDDQRVMIAADVLRIKEQRAAKKRQQEAGKHGAAGGRGHRKTLTANSTQGFRAPTTVQKIAAAAKGTEHQARQAVAVANHAPELAEEVKRGTIPLREAAQQVAEQRTALQTTAQQTAAVRTNGAHSPSGAAAPAKPRSKTAQLKMARALERIVTAIYRSSWPLDTPADTCELVRQLAMRLRVARLLGLDKEPCSAPTTGANSNASPTSAPAQTRI